MALLKVWPGTVSAWRHSFQGLTRHRPESIVRDQLFVLVVAAVEGHPESVGECRSDATLPLSLSLGLRFGATWTSAWLPEWWVGLFVKFEVLSLSVRDGDGRKGDDV